MTKRNFNRLCSAIDKRNATWLEHAEPDIARALESEISDGASLAEIEEFATTLSGERDWFARRLVSAGRHFHSERADRAPNK